MKTIVSEVFAAAYTKKDGTIGFLGNDNHSGGYPYFKKDSLDIMYRRNIAGDAHRDVQMILNNMRTYYGSDEIDFDTVRVVRFQMVVEEIENINEVIKECLVESAKSKLTDDELQALINANSSPT